MVLMKTLSDAGNMNQNTSVVNRNLSRIDIVNKIHDDIAAKVVHHCPCRNRLRRRPVRCRSCVGSARVPR